jgi:hypothetical protein
MAALWCALAACAEPAPTPVVVAAPPPPAVPPATVVPPGPPSEPRAVALLGWDRQIEAPVVSFAFGKKRMAALGTAGACWILERGKWKEAPVPAELRAGDGERDDVRIFFGRDDWPRIMGSRFAGSAASAVYLRYKGAWRREPGEIGRLAGEPAAAMYGVLGHDDPEVVCKVGDTCIIKRLTGWTNVPPASEPLRVDLWGGQAWGVGAGGLQRLEADGWHPADLAWRATMPIAEPRAIWVVGADDVWLVGAGVFHWDGSGWRAVKAPEGRFGDVRGTSATEVWIAGDAGLWRGSR